MRTWSITIPAPCEWINANKREHWRTTADKVAEWRTAGCAAATQAKLPTIKRAHIDAVLHFRNSARRDAHNWYPTLKALVDGLVDHGLLADDSTRYLTGPDIRVGDVLPKAPYGPVGEVVLTITEVAP